MKSAEHTSGKKHSILSLVFLANDVRKLRIIICFLPTFFFADVWIMTLKNKWIITRKKSHPILLQVADFKTKISRGWWDSIRLTWFNPEALATDTEFYYIRWWCNSSYATYPFGLWISKAIFFFTIILLQRCIDLKLSLDLRRNVSLVLFSGFTCIFKGYLQKL